jgi:hypothetical protein
MQNGKDHGYSTDERLAKAAENSLLVLLSRWSSMILVPVVIGTGGWMISGLQSLKTEMAMTRAELAAQATLFDQKLRSVDANTNLRLTNVERRVDRLELLQDRRSQSQPEGQRAQ